MQAGILFKFTKPPDGLTRRAMFYKQPTWDELADKIQSLYGIPKDTVGVSYVDVDGDEVTLSSQDELQDFYQFNLHTARGFGQSGDAMKATRFTVRDLSVIRDSDPDKPLPRTPSTGSNLNNRDTFGISNQHSSIFDSTDDWEPISAFPPGVAPNIFIPIIPEESPAPHAFLEPVPSDVGTIMQNDDKDTASSVTETDYGAPIKADKGKQKASVEDIPDDDDDDAASTVSVVASNSPKKPPIHVTSHVSSEDIFGARRTAEPVSDREATPKSVEKEVTSEVDDPPLPELEDIQATFNANTSLANDVARLLTTFSTVLASHPELSEGVRNIVHNATNGAYWTAHREAVARAAQEVRRNAEQSVEDARRVAEDAHHAAEEAAGRRVTEALGSIARTINQYTGQSVHGATATNDDPVTSTPVTARNPQEGPQRRPNPPRRPAWRHSWFGPNGSRGDPFDPHFEPFFSNGGDMHRPSRSFFFPGWNPPPPPPPGPYAPPPPPPPFPPNGATFPPPPPPPPPGGMPFGMPPLPPNPMPGAWPPSFATGFRRAWGAADAATPRTVVEPTGPSEIPAASQAQTEPMLSAKEALQAAKEKYKAEKERYRREREMRRLQRQRMMNSSSEAERYAESESSEDDGDSDVGVDGSNQPLLSKTDEKKDEPDYTEIKGPAEPNVASSSVQTEEPETQIVSNARGGFPQLEMFSLSPRRHHTVHGTGRRGYHARGLPENIYAVPPPPPVISVASPVGPPPQTYNPFMSQSASILMTQSVTGRLADMGFTTATYPDLRAKVNASVARLDARNASGDSDVSRDAEDSVVAEVVEELLSAPAPGPSTAGTSNLRRSNTSLPGGWDR